MQEHIEAFPYQLLTNVEMFNVLMKLLWTIIDIRFLVYPRTNCIYYEKENTFLLGYDLIYYLFEEINKLLSLYNLITEHSNISVINLLF